MSLTRESLIEYLHSKQGIDPSEIENDDTELFSTGLLDSFSMVDLIMFIETEAGLKMNQSDVTLENLDSVGRILAYAQAAVN